MNERNNFDHYVAQHYIKLFTDKNMVAHIGDISNKRVTSTSDFGKFLGRENWSVDQTIEDGFTGIETKIARALRTTKANPESIRGLARPTAKALRDFICLHTARTVGIHNMMNQAALQTKSELRRIAPSHVNIAKLGFRDATRPESLMMGIEVANAVEVALNMMGCIAILAPFGQQFLLGDEPLATLSTQENWYLKGGLPNKSTYLWFPLNPKVGLFFGYGIGNILTKDQIRTICASKKLINLLNRAEVFQSVQYILGSSRGFIRGKVRLPNVGRDRVSVKALDWAPFVFMINNVVSPISEEIIVQIQSRL